MENRSFYNEILTEHNLHPEFKHDLARAEHFHKLAGSVHRVHTHS